MIILIALLSLFHAVLGRQAHGFGSRVLGTRGGINDGIPEATPSRPDVDWDSFGFSLNGVRTEKMFVARTSTGKGAAVPWAEGGSLREHGPIDLEPVGRQCVCSSYRLITIDITGCDSVKLRAGTF